MADGSERVAPLCKYDGCGKDATSHGWCGMHWSRIRRHGDPGHERETLAERLARRSERDSSTGCLLWTGAVKGKDGYGLTSWEGGDLAHRAAYTLAYGSIPTGALVCHRCDVPNCIEPTHLFLGSVADNNRDREKKGRGWVPRGEQHYRARLTEDDVRAIRQAYADGETIKSLAGRYDYSPGAMGMLVHRKIWKSVA